MSLSRRHESCLYLGDMSHVSNNKTATQLMTTEHEPVRVCTLPWKIPEDGWELASASECRWRAHHLRCLPEAKQHVVICPRSKGKTLKGPGAYPCSRGSSSPK